jgi:copper chaperone CopZ
MELIELEITGGRRINCERCERRIADGLADVSGVFSVRAYAKNQRINVEINGQTNAEEVKDRLLSLGYEVRRVA